MLCVMRRERIGVLHLDKYSPPKAICSVGKRREKGKKKRGEESIYLINLIFTLLESISMNFKLFLSISDISIFM